MHLIPVKTRTIVLGDDLASIIASSADIRDGDIIAVSSKVVAIAEGSSIELRKLAITDQAKDFAARCGRSPAFCQAVIEETKRMNGKVVGNCPGALLTEVKPQGLMKGVILTANAGLDESNVKSGSAIGWPVDAARSADKLRRQLEVLIRMPKRPKKPRMPTESWNTSDPSSWNNAQDKPRLGVLITDSCCRLRRWGVTAFALSVSGFAPLAHQAGRGDIHGKPLRITTEAIADQLATAANMLMGNAGQSIPACIIRDHGVPLADVAGWVDGIEPEEDLFKAVISVQ